MNLPVQMSGQISGQVPNQAQSQLPGLVQQNGSSVPNQRQNLGGHRNAMNMGPELINPRKFIQEKIFQILLQLAKKNQPSYADPQKIQNAVRFFEDILYRKATSREEYTNMATLETRLRYIMQNFRKNPSQTYAHSQFGSSSSSIGAMIPTPGLPHSGNSSIMNPSPANSSSSVARASNSLAPATGTGSTLLSNVNGPTANGHPSSADITVSSIREQRMTSQMIPTPGFINSTAGAASSSESAVLSQPQQQKQLVGAQNTWTQQSLGCHSGSRVRPGGLQNGAPSGGSRMMRSHMPLTDSGTSEGYRVAGNPSQPQYGQHQLTVQQGNIYRMRAPDSTGSGNIFGPESSTSSALNNQSLSPANLLLRTSISPSVKTNKSNLNKSQHPGCMVSQSTESSNKLNLQGANTLQENLQQSHQQDISRQPRPSVQQQYSHDQSLQKRPNQQHVALVKNEPFTDCGMPCNSNNTLSKVSEQFLHSQKPSVNSQDNSGCPSAGLHAERPLSDQWHTKSLDGFELPGDTVHDKHFQEDFHQRIIVRDEAQRNNLSSETSLCQITTETAKPPNAYNYIMKSGNPDLDRQFFRQVKWCLFLYHARKCTMPEGKCAEEHCIYVRKLLKHMNSCNLINQCPYPRCSVSKKLLHHRRTCESPDCPVCSTIQKFKEAQMKLRARADSTKPNLPCSASSQCNTYDGGVAVETSDDVQHASKRIKTEQSFQSLPPGTETRAFIQSCVGFPVGHDSQHPDYQQGDTCMSVKAEGSTVTSEIPSNTGYSITDVRKDGMDTRSQNPVGKPIVSGDSFSAQQECIKVETDLDQSKHRNVTLPADIGSVTKCGKPKIKGVSMVELFTPEQVRQHILSLRQWVGQTKTRAEKNQAMEHSMSEGSCQLCAVERLAFEPPPIYCTPCGSRIKRNTVYYTVGSGPTLHCFCVPCYHDTRGDTILVDGSTISKERLEKKRNDVETEEGWVQCDKCEAWQHQICALFNCRRNEGGQAEYTCPNCYLAEVGKGERLPLPHSAVLGAKDLPRTILSDHIEQRLFRRLREERQERARLQGKSYDEVFGAEDLVIRVVSSVDKKMEIKQRFLEIFQEKNYPTEFPYKSKVVLLFQRIEGVEVCLFGMYVQEFGSECEQPNHRRVYLSYLDSVKYFRPDIKAVTGEALRTFVYHEILIGYLEYCKKRGFTSCYIWACPPLKGEDYILYCHPEIQKTPKSDKLREWYLSMLKKASKENIVVDIVNFYDNFFLTTGECKAKVTAARLPYFDGDYWPGAAEDIIYQLRQEEDGRKQNKKGIIKKPLTKRALRASGQNDLSGNVSTDLLLMHKLGETISPMKEDFIMVHLQHACTHCGVLMVSGNRWVCNQCKNFELCDKCYEAEKMVEDRERHPINQKDKHSLRQIEIIDVPEETMDKDNNIESELFDTRQAFLSLCQGNHYQYDTLRRAKHSSMMVLYHLHNPTAPAFAATCNICHLDVEAGQGWRCEVCTDYDVCNTCYQRDGGIKHPHKLINQSMAECDAQNGEARERRLSQLKKMLDLLVHASHCRSIICQYPNCRKVKGLFRHGIACKMRAAGGCKTCQKMWHLLQLHARACKASECTVPRCRDLKIHVRRTQQQSESRRRAAVKEMMRQRSAEVTGNTR